MLLATMTQSNRYNPISSRTIIALLLSLVTVYCRPVSRHPIDNDHQNFQIAPGEGSHAVISSEISPPMEMNGMLFDNYNHHVQGI